jgi:hypothetical protein
MLSTHAILWLDKRAMLEAADLMTTSGLQIDMTLAREQWRWFVACVKVPFWWQNDGRHRSETFDYAPGSGSPARAHETPWERKTRVVAERRGLRPPAPMRLAVNADNVWVRQ